MNKPIYCYDEPLQVGDRVENLRQCFTREAAIADAKRSLGNNVSNEEALAEWIAINWAEERT